MTDCIGTYSDYLRKLSGTHGFGVYTLEWIPQSSWIFSAARQTSGLCGKLLFIGSRRS